MSRGSPWQKRGGALSLEPDAPKTRPGGIVAERALSDYLHLVFPVLDKTSATSRKTLSFQNVEHHLDLLLAPGAEEPERGAEAEGRLGPDNIVLDHTSGFEGLLLVDEDLLGVIGHSNFSTIRATTCVHTGKWMYEVLLSSKGLMQIGWCTLDCRFNQEEGVGDTPNSYAYDGNRVRKWNVTTTNYGKPWAAGDVVTCLIDLDDASISFCLNGLSMGVAFPDVRLGPGFAYFPAISLSFRENVSFNFGSRPLRYPVEGYRPLQDPPTTDLMQAQRLMGYFQVAMETWIDPRDGRVVSREDSRSLSRGDAATTFLLTAVHIFHKLAPLLAKAYVVDEVLLKFLLSLQTRASGSVATETPAILHTLDLLWALLEEFEVHSCLKQLMMTLLRAFRFSPVTPDMTPQIQHLRLVLAILKHEKSRKFLLGNVLFDVMRFVVFCNVKTPLRVEEAGLDETIPITWWPTNLQQQQQGREEAEESAEERHKRRSYERGCQRLKKRIEVVEDLQVAILKLLLNNKDKNSQGEASRYIFLSKLRKFLQENASNRNPTMLCPPEYMLCFMHRLITALRSCWDGHRQRSAHAQPSEEAYVPPQLFYNGKVDYFDLQRLGGLITHLKKTLKDDLAAVGVTVEAAELSPVSMDDLDDVEEAGLGLPVTRRAGIGGIGANGAAAQTARLGMSMFRGGLLPKPHRRGGRPILNAASAALAARRAPGFARPRQATTEMEQRTEEEVETGVLHGRPITEAEDPPGDHSLIEILDGIVMMYSMSVHQQLGKMVGVSDDVREFAVALRETEEKIARCPPQRRDVLEELQRSRDVFLDKLNQLSRRLAWINTTIYSQERLRDVYWLLRVCLRTVERADLTGPLLGFLPEFYVSAAMGCYSAIKNYFSPVSCPDELPGYQQTLTQLATILTKHFVDSRIIGTDIKDSLMQALASFVCYPDSLKAVERTPADIRVSMMRSLLAPYEQRPWAQTNWILVRLWKGCGFGYRYTRLPHLLRIKPEDLNNPTLQKPCPSRALQAHAATLLRTEAALAAGFINSVLNQLNWAFSEFIGMIQEIQQTAERPERNYIDSRQLKVCATCFDLSVSLLRVLEMATSLAPEAFTDFSRPSAELLLTRLAQLINQVLNRVTSERNLFDRVVNLRLPGLDTVDHYPILVSLTGILVQLLVDGTTQSAERASRALLADPCFQLRCVQYLLGETHEREQPRGAATPDKRFSLRSYVDFVSAEEVEKVTKMIARLSDETKQAAAAAMPTDEEDLCPICYAHPISALFQPCTHKSCMACIRQHLMNNKECFFCKTPVTAVEAYTKTPASTPTGL
uniref:E3 ubiquitin-protein ligase RNF123 n=1 Tax=Petromyzon marinus TaxID=7757 RepID=A0AAJ7TSP3_PETMA|nr:E3 ubiquitin-protein ligase RNF123 isoform X1 [Petromyzon marinus]XP_032822271.1 E3 ubiquitin-protein ligase RNF123 isoform X2 [Petromyzon marinus]